MATARICAHWLPPLQQMQRSLLRVGGSVSWSGIVQGKGIRELNVQTAASLVKTMPMTTEKAEQLYNEWADNYEDHMLQWGYKTPRKVAELAFDLHSSGTALDLGCGAGAVGSSLRNLGFTGNLTGMDVSRRMLEKCELQQLQQLQQEEERQQQSKKQEQQKQQQSIYTKLFHASIEEEWPLESSSLDLICAAGVLGYVKDFHRLYSETVRVLQPGGHVVASLSQSSWDNDDQKCQSILQSLQDQRLLDHVSTVRDITYMPQYPDQELKRAQVCILVLKRCENDDP
eukprot:TRINITY_DN21737_c0_g1_i1.p1 TRINITY_DN21737_c0_g1~~TRINITY_DN21737_c0_g1_i1.p1  ORF type:complete len:294 (+),score=56.57 TRINITY_DN21737_c0_g1_i1:26-883(+)